MLNLVVGKFVQQIMKFSTLTAENDDVKRGKLYAYKKKVVPIKSVFLQEVSCTHKKQATDTFPSFPEANQIIAIEC